jgi:hypothetical protein
MAEPSFAGRGITGVPVSQDDLTLALFILSDAEINGDMLAGFAWRVWGDKVLFEVQRPGGRKVYYDRPVIKTPT